MAENGKELFNTDYAVAISGIADLLVALKINLLD